MIEPEEPSRPVWLTPEKDPEPAAEGSRQTLLLVGGGAVVLVLVAGLAAFALFSGGSEPDRPHARSAAAEPVVAVSPAEPAPGESATPGTAAPSTAKAAPTPTPTQNKPRVTTASISVEPAGMTGPCPRVPRSVRVKVTVTITVSTPEVQVRYTVDGGKEHSATPQSKTYTDSWEAEVRRAAGTSTSTLKVTAPSAASDTATFTYTCD
ncbi:hypothetical protein [Dactylosporangium sp. NPDC005555]|uniref:hypothetical protein n=1 Tax=Dactylosporangium sp. NPDC005555 TaxID=3154889 RepID=UPI0033B38C9C